MNNLKISCKTDNEKLNRISTEVILEFLNILDFVSHFHDILCSLLKEDSVYKIFWNVDF